MTDQDQTFITEMLRKIQSDVTLILREHGDWLIRIELRLSTIEQTLGNLSLCAFWQRPGKHGRPGTPD